MLASALPGGAIAQLGERLLCKQEVVGSIPSGSTNLRGVAASVGKPALELRRLPEALAKAGFDRALVREN